LAPIWNRIGLPTDIVGEVLTERIREKQRRYPDLEVNAGLVLEMIRENLERDCKRKQRAIEIKLQQRRREYEQRRNEQINTAVLAGALPEPHMCPVCANGAAFPAGAEMICASYACDPEGRNLARALNSRRQPERRPPQHEEKQASR
jgi:hypothetical protein